MGVIASPVSVIIPTKNRNEYLKRAIASVILQNYPGLEVCIVDNNDDRHLSAAAREIVEQYEARHTDIKWIFLHSDQKHASGVKNDGMKAVSHKYICFLDDDDELLQDSIAIRVKEMLADDQLALLYCAGFSMIYPYPFRIYRYYHHHEEKNNEMLRMMSCSSMIINKDIFKQYSLLFDESLSRLEDYDMGKTMLKNGMKVKSIPDPLVMLHHHPYERMSTYTPFDMDFRKILVTKWQGNTDDYIYNYIAGHFIWRSCFGIEKKKYSEVVASLKKDFNKTPSMGFSIKYHLVSFSPSFYLALYHCLLILWQFYQNKVYWLKKIFR